MVRAPNPTTVRRMCKISSRDTKEYECGLSLEEGPKMPWTNVA